MKEIESLLKQLVYVHNRTHSFFKQIQESPFGMEALYWRMPFGKGRAHMGWQFMHLAATYHKFAYYCNPSLYLDQKFIEEFGHGSIPNEKNIISISEIWDKLDLEFKKFYGCYENFPEEKLDEKPVLEINRTHRENIYLMLWHEASHLGQCQITWNSFRAMKEIIS